MPFTDSEVGMVSVARRLTRVVWLRRALVPVFARVNPGEVTIRNHYTGHPLRLHSFRHKGYWYHGRSREAASMALFKRLIRPGDLVVEVGGHIGYISQYFSQLVGAAGRVVVFEPGPNNLPFLRRNTRDLPNVEVVELGVGREQGRADFFVEQLTGQNNSFVAEFEGLAANAHAAGVDSRVETVSVEMTSLDAHLAEGPSFIKIDVEGFELPVLQGASRILEQDRPLLMVEIQADREAVAALASRHGYEVLGEDLAAYNWDEEFLGNSFWFHREAHAALLQRLRDRSTE
jgi:FkbM family methyltransferase